MALMLQRRFVFYVVLLYFADRNRGRSRRRSFFRNLKERLSRSKNRSRSVDPGTPGRDDSLNRDDPLVRSVSADRGRSGVLFSFVC